MTTEASPNTTRSVPPLTSVAPRGGLRRPAGLAEQVDVSTMVDPDRGLVDRAVFTDEAVYRQEMRRIFARSWLFLAHTDQFKKPGDCFQTFMGEDPIIVTMDKKKQVRAYLNSCRHRGARVRRADQMGIGSERDEPGYPGKTSELCSDAAGRGFYRRWRELMGTPAWHENAVGHGPNDEEGNPQ